jgi:hypothetical protein
MNPTFCLLTLIASEKSAIKKLRRANKPMDTKNQALRSTIQKSLLHDGPGLFSAAAGTEIYVGHLPDMLSTEPQKTAPPQSASQSP